MGIILLALNLTFFINLYTYTKRLGVIPVDLNVRCVVAEEIGDRDKDTMHPLKWNCTMSVASSLVKK